MRASSTSGMWLTGALLLVLAAILWFAVVGNTMLGVLFLVIAAMFAVFALTMNRGAG